MKYLSLLILFAFSSAIAGPEELKPQSSGTDLQFGLGCNYRVKDSMDWTLLMYAEQALPQTLYLAIYNKKNKTYMGEWQVAGSSNSRLIYVEKKSFDEVRLLLLYLFESEIHFKKNPSDSDVLFFLPLGDYRKNHPEYFIDNVNINRGCVVSEDDLPKT